jgi:hypothetical protein
VQGAAIRAERDLLAAAGAVGDDETALVRGSHLGSERELRHLFRDGFVLRIVTEAARHSATARLDRLDVQLRNERERSSNIGHELEGFLVAMPVQQGALLRQRAAVEPKAPVRSLARDELLERDGLRGEGRGPFTEAEGQELVAQPLHATHSSNASCIASEVNASGPSCPESASRRVLARPRVVCSSSRVTRYDGHMVPASNLRQAPLLLHISIPNQQATSASKDCRLPRPTRLYYCLIRDHMKAPPGRHFLQIPGPTNVPDRVLRAMDLPTIDHRGPEFQRLARQVLEGMQGVLETRSPVIIYPASGTGAWEAALVNTLSPGDRVLVVEVCMPPGHSEVVLRKLILERFNLSLGSGLGRLQDKVFRIGHLGDFNDLMLLGTLAGIEMGLHIAGVPHRSGGVDAAMAHLREEATPARAAS